MKKEITKLEILQRIHSLPRKSKNLLLEIMEYMNDGYVFMQSQMIPDKMIDKIPSQAYFAEGGNGSWAKLCREGFLIREYFGDEPMYYRHSPLLELISIEEYTQYAKRIDEINDLLKIREIEDDYEDNWVDIFRGERGDKKDFEWSKQRQKELKENFSLHDVVFVNIRGEDSIGCIVKMNPVRARVRLNNGKKWNCPYSNLHHSKEAYQSA